MFVVGVGPDVLRTELEYIATNHDDKHLFTAANYSSLDSILPPLVALVCDGKKYSIVNSFKTNTFN